SYHSISLPCHGPKLFRVAFVEGAGGCGGGVGVSGIFLQTDLAAKLGFQSLAAYCYWCFKFLVSGDTNHGIVIWIPVMNPKVLDPNRMMKIKIAIFG
ncbi:MAG: hypothetical protein ACXWCG_07420, partial [Flavitalea sp.]